MKRLGFLRKGLLPLAAIILSACATTATLVEAPAVSLSGVELKSVDFRRQTFLLTFDVRNPNAFPLPVKAVDYEVILDDQKFAGGRTQGSFSVPARGESAFAISVDLDILNSTSHFRSLMSGGYRENMSYELRGSLAVDMPFVKPIPFSNSGVINMTQTAAEEFE